MIAVAADTFSVYIAAAAGAHGYPAMIQLRGPVAHSSSAWRSASNEFQLE